MTVDPILFFFDGRAIAARDGQSLAAALTEAKAGKDLPEGNCTSPVTRDFDLGRRIGLDGTPAIYSDNGTQLGGYVPPAEMLARLDEIAAKSAE